MAQVQAISSSLPAVTLEETALRHDKIQETEDFGDFVSNEDEEVDVEWVNEDWSRYDPKETSRVLYPICLGDVLSERYLIEHKIGFGGFSTVWMAYDLQDERDVALKVMCAGDWGEQELLVQNEIIQSVEDTSHLVTYSATFLLRGQDFQHRVFVFPLLGPCLDSLLVKEMSLTARMSTARQLLKALENLHKAGIVHRDLSERNCMLGLSPLHNLSRASKYELLGRPLRETIPFADTWKKGELVRPIKIPKSLRTEDIYLGDFGLAKKLDNPVTQRGYPSVHFCSPERLHNKDPSPACDMWAYMVIFSELYLGFLPFATFFEGGIITDYLKCFGPLPEEWKGLYIHPNGIDSWYDQRVQPDPKRSLASRITQFRPDADATELELVCSVMRKVFTYRPEERLTAAQLLQDKSFKALMKKYGC